MGDLERLVSKVAAGKINPREMVQLKNAMIAIAPVKEGCLASENEVLKHIGDQLNGCKEIRERIAKEIEPDPPGALNKGKVIRPEVSAELDELREIAYSGEKELILSGNSFKQGGTGRLERKTGKLPKAI